MITVNWLYCTIVIIHFNRISDLKRHLKASIEDNTTLLEKLLKAREETGYLLQQMVQDQTTYVQILKNQLPTDQGYNHVLYEYIIDH